MTTAESPAPRPTSSWRAALVVVSTVYVALVLWITLRPLPWAIEGNQTAWGVLNPAAWTDADAWVSGRPIEILANVAMFLPAGILAGLLLRGPMRLIAPLALTVMIEVGQIFLNDRISHPRDLVANALGAVIGLIVVGVGIRMAGTPAGAEQR